MIGSLNLSYQLMYLSLSLYGKQQNFSRAKQQKKVDFASFLPPQTLVWNYFMVLQSFLTNLHDVKKFYMSLILLYVELIM